MQQAIYNDIAIQTTKTITTAPTPRRASLGRRIAQKWDLYGVLALMGSSAAYGLFAIAHTL